jgi:alkylation response protein AidB-like acyl-CoA dehydrogenase
MAKLYATELASRVADLSLQLHGAHGYHDDTEVARDLPRRTSGYHRGRPE